MQRSQEGSAKVFVLAGIGCVVAFLALFAGAAFVLLSTRESPETSSVQPRTPPAQAPLPLICEQAIACCVAVQHGLGGTPGDEASCESIRIAAAISGTPSEVCASHLELYADMSEGAAVCFPPATDPAGAKNTK